MPKGLRRVATSDGSARDTANEITVRSYDRCMRGRFDEALKSINILLEISEGLRSSDEHAEARAMLVVNLCFGRDLFAELRARTLESRDNLRALANQYDLSTVAYLIDESIARSRRYFALMSCENLDSFLWDICAKLHAQIENIQEIIEYIEDSQNPSRAINRPKVREDKAYYPPEQYVRGGQVTRLSASAKRAAKASSRALSGDRAEIGDARTCSGAHMSPQHITSVIQHESEGVSFSALQRTLKLANDCIARAMKWSRAIYLRGADALCCEDCGARVRVLQDMSETICDKCGRIATIINYGAIEDANAAVGENAQDGARGRRCGYNYIRHLKIWLDRLQAIENTEFDSRDIARIRASIESEYMNANLVNWRALCCDDIVRHLSLCGLSHLGEHVPKLLKELGGRAPPFLDYDSEQIVMRDFMHIMDVYAHLYHEPGNKPYYPFFIAKIIKRRFKENPELYRMLFYVSKQGHETVNKNDRIYRQICEAAPAHYDLVYEPEVD